MAGATSDKTTKHLNPWLWVRDLAPLIKLSSDMHVHTSPAASLTCYFQTMILSSTNRQKAY